MISRKKMILVQKNSIFGPKICVLFTPHPYNPPFWGSNGPDSMGPKMNFRTQNYFFLYQTYEASVFLQKTALNFVKYGLQSPTYDLHLHIGGRHSVLYFSIQATEKYSTEMFYTNPPSNTPITTLVH